MTPCEELTAVLARGEQPAETLLHHASECPPCGAMLLVDAHLTHAAVNARALQPSPALTVLLSSPVVPARTFSALRRAWAPVVSAALVATVIVAVHPRQDLAGQSGPLFWAVALGWLGITALGVASVLARGRTGLGVPSVVRWGFVATALTVFVALAVGATRGAPGSITDPAAVGVGLHLHCAGIGSVVALAVLGVLLSVSRRSAAVSPVSAGVTAGVAAGFAGVLALQCVCHVAVPVHVALAHGAAVAVAALAGAVVGRRVLAP